MCDFLIRDLSFDNLELDININDSIMGKLARSGIRSRKNDDSIEVLHTISDNVFINLKAKEIIYYTLLDVVDNSLVYEPRFSRFSRFRAKEPESLVQHHRDGIHVERMIMKALGYDQITRTHPNDEIMIAEDITSYEKILDGIPPVFLRSDFVSLYNRLNSLKLSMEKTMVTA